MNSEHPSHVDQAGTEAQMWRGKAKYWRSLAFLGRDEGLRQIFLHIAAEAEELAANLEPFGLGDAD